ncbi:hypothetical protein Ancab_038463 [Ancistrocladus abbreviatus]
MPGMANYAVEHDHGCGFMTAIFQSRRSSSIKLLPSSKREGNWPNLAKSQSLQVVETPTKKLALPNSRPSVSKKQNQTKRVSDAKRKPTSALTSSSLSSSNGSNTAIAREEGEEVSNGSRALIKAPSGNIMLLGQMGNTKRQPASETAATIGKVGYYHNLTMGNIVRKSSGETRLLGSINKPDSEALKMMGNEKYKQGKFEDALQLYDQAIALDSSKASYRCNKSAALIGLGRLLEAVWESREAIRIQPCYHRAHLRLATLYIRLGYAERALHHLKHSGSLAGSKDIAEAKALQGCINRCNEAEKKRDWTTLLKETRCALSGGADSAIQIYAQQVEALLNLLRHEEAYAAFKRAPSFDIDSYARLFGLDSASRLCSTRARVYMAAGRFEDAFKAAEHATQLNPRDKEVKALVQATQDVGLARSRGNKLFKESKYAEASNAYSKGLEHKPYNSVLLCNQAACRSKLGQFEKAIEDCSLALSLQPSYCKARLRRADCNAKLERWEASIEDYEILMREATWGHEEIARALLEARLRLTKQRCLS